MKVYLAKYCSCRYESAYSTLSIHKNIDGANKAISDHKEGRLSEYNEIYGDLSEDDSSYMSFSEFIEDEIWNIEEKKYMIKIYKNENRSYRC